MIRFTPSLSLPNLIAGALIALLCASCGRPCLEECYDVCDVYCDLFGCWRECYTECVCVEGVTCLNNRDCARGLVCVSGDCFVYESKGLCETCSAHSSCVEQGALCLTLPESGERVCGRHCNADRDCPSSYTCSVLSNASGRQCVPISNSCQSAAVGCVRDSECADASRRCEQGRCIEINATCVSDADCTTGKTCREGRCEALECVKNEDCAGASVCLDAECRSTCTTNAHCSAEHVCSNGLCVLDDRVSCRVNSECSERFLCVNSTCKPDCSMGCPRGYLCKGELYCDVDPQTACGADAMSCAADARCDEGFCRQTCAQSADCDAGLTCHSARGVCIIESAPRAAP